MQTSSIDNSSDKIERVSTHLKYEHFSLSYQWTFHFLIFVNDKMVKNKYNHYNGYEIIMEWLFINMRPILCCQWLWSNGLWTQSLYFKCFVSSLLLAAVFTKNIPNYQMIFINILDKKYGTTVGRIQEIGVIAFGAQKVRAVIKAKVAIKVKVRVVIKTKSGDKTYGSVIREKCEMKNIEQKLVG
eukprot:463419_1